MEQGKPKRIPYGMQNWEDVRLQNCYYVDKTRFIPEIEAANHFFFFIRPRRFGKSLLMNMLRQYYDVLKAPLFERLFGNLWIGQHPTEAHNTYLVLYLNFAAFSGGLEGYKKRMDDYCNIRYVSFLRSYADYFAPNMEEELNLREGAANQLSFLVDACDKAGQQMYLFIDEYDHFTNSILSDPDMEIGYKAETHGTGAFRAFFDAIKAGTDSAIKRLFVTGVSPVTMDDLTSGFNIGTNYTMEPEFNAMVGFTEEEVREMLDYYRQHFPFQHTTDELLDIIRPWYDNYCFSVNCLNEPTMYNSDMVLYFVYFYTKDKGRLPDNMLDKNIRTDYSKLRMLIRKDRGFQNDASIIQHIVETGGIEAEIKDSFPSEAITQPTNFISLLYYFGMLTIAGRGFDGLFFRIPNQAVREQIYGYLMEAYRDNDLFFDDWEQRRLVRAMAADGDWHPFFEAMSDILKRFASQRDLQKGENFVHGFTLANTCLINLYMPHSELDAGVGGGYADIYLEPRLNIYPQVAHSYVLELKYRRSTATDAQIESARREATDQLLRYEQRSEVITRTIGHTHLHRLILVWRGMDLVVAEEL